MLVFSRGGRGRYVCAEEKEQDARRRMERILNYEIPENFIGHKISEFLHNKGYSKQNLTVLKRMPESILVNGVWVHLNERLKAGDILTVHITETEVSQKIPPVELPFPIVYEDEDLVVINKPANMPIHPSMKNYENTLGNAAAYYYEKQGKPFVYRCINRLDKDTTGLTIIAKHLVSCGILYTAMEQREIKREYIAIVEGEDIPESGTVDLPLGRKPDSAIERMVDYEHGDRAVTHYRVLAKGGGLALLSLHLDTGRTHQIRVHMKEIGHPLIGDFLYHPENTQMDRQALHATKLEFTHPITGQELMLTAPLPEDMQKALENAGICYK